ncbi:MAG: hypothetical protein HOP11_07780 [Saprospiraceae bacterium]|nr:hypothetical protein [Saprospiraceae bacterium]
MESFDFNELRKKIVSFLDKDMNPEEEKLFLHHVKQNPTLNREIEHQQSIRSKIKQSFQRPDLAPGLHDRILDSIRGKR